MLYLRGSCDVAFKLVHLSLFSNQLLESHGTPGRVLALCRDKDLKLEKLTQFVLDECDKCLDKLDMRKATRLFCNAKLSSTRVEAGFRYLCGTVRLG